MAELEQLGLDKNLYKITDNPVSIYNKEIPSENLLYGEIDEDIRMNSLVVKGDTSTIDGKNISGFSTVVNDGATPAVPTGLTGEETTLGVLLQWSKNAETDIQSYEVWRNTSDDSSTAEKIATINTTLFVDISPNNNADSPNGVIIPTNIDTFTVSYTVIRNPRVFKISNQIYLIALFDDFTRTYRLATYWIDNTGNIDPFSSGAISTSEFLASTSFTYKGGICQIPNTIIFVAVSTSTDDDGFIKTFTISSGGTITNTDTYEFSTVDMTTSDVIHAVDTYYAIAYHSSGQINLSSINISNTGVITASLADTVNVVSTSDLNRNIVLFKHPSPTSNNVILLFYKTTTDNDLYLKTHTISATGIFTGVDTQLISSQTTTNGAPLYIDHVAGNIFVLGYDNDSSSVIIDTYIIDGVGNITNAATDTQTIRSSTTATPAILGKKIADNTFVFSSTGADDDGFLDTYTIADNGTITDTAISSYEFDTANAVNNGSIIQIKNRIYLLAYQDTNSDLKLVTIQFDGSTSTQYYWIKAVDNLGNTSGFSSGSEAIEIS